MTSFKYDVPGCYNHAFKPGSYFIILYGAQGGQCGENVPYGGYTSGTLRVHSNTTYYLCVGGKGASGKKPENVTGGFNGGGDGAFGYSKYCHGGGGGRTEIRIDESDANSVIMVAGGGGGSCEYVNNNNMKVVYMGGRGGGKQGEDGQGVDKRAGTGATQYSPGKGGHYDGNTANNYPPIDASNGTKGNGGNAAAKGDASAAGGGGGYYGGGGAADYGGGGGGSGYFSPYLIIGGKTGFSTNTGDGSIIIIPNFYVYTPSKAITYPISALIMIALVYK